jgi:hypothetical protein
MRKCSAVSPSGPDDGRDFDCCVSCTLRKGCGRKDTRCNVSSEVNPECEVCQQYVCNRPTKDPMMDLAKRLIWENTT